MSTTWRDEAMGRSLRRPSLTFLSNNMTVNFSVFCSLVEDLVCRNLNDRLVVTL